MGEFRQDICGNYERGEVHSIEGGETVWYSMGKWFAGRGAWNPDAWTTIITIIGEADTAENAMQLLEVSDAQIKKQEGNSCQNTTGHAHYAKAT